MQCELFFAFVLIILASFCESGQSKIIQDLSSFIQSRGQKYAIVIYTTPKPPISPNIFKNRDAFYTRLLPSNTSEIAAQFHYNLDFLVFVIESLDDLTANPDLVKMIEANKVEKTLIMVKSKINVNPDLATFIGQNLHGSAYFFVKFEDSNFIRVIKLKGTNQPVINMADAPIDFGGLTVESLSISWSPYFVLDDCNDDGQNCKKQIGFVGDVLSLMGDRYNFTWNSDKEVNEDWGLKPLNNTPYDRVHGIWGGVMGAVINGDVHFSASTWSWTYERWDLMDFIPLIPSTKILVLTPQQPSFDPGLYFRPFRNESWFVTCAVTLVMLSSFFFIYKLIPDRFENSDSFMAANNSLWFCFVLLNAYYGGAMTMFFTSEVSIPINSVLDALRAYPDWVLKLKVATDVYIQSGAIAEDPDYIIAWKRMEANREEFFYPDVKTALNSLKENREVFLAGEGQLKGFFRNNPFHVQDLKVVAREKPIYSCLVAPKNSPLTPIFNDEAITLIERGTMQKLVNEWEGMGIPSTESLDTMVLTSGQTVMVYMFMGSAYMLTMICFCIEVMMQPTRTNLQEKILN